MDNAKRTMSLKTEILAFYSFKKSIARYKEIDAVTYCNLQTF